MGKKVCREDGGILSTGKRIADNFIFGGEIK
jgi:hypothetical protein